MQCAELMCVGAAKVIAVQVLRCCRCRRHRVIPRNRPRNRARNRVAPPVVLLTSPIKWKTSFVTSTPIKWKASQLQFPKFPLPRKLHFLHSGTWPEEQSHALQERASVSHASATARLHAMRSYVHRSHLGYTLLRGGRVKMSLPTLC